MKNGPNVNQMTQAVLIARAKYPDILQSIISKLNTPAPYMKERLDSRAVDKALLQMTPEQMTQLAYTDPVAAENAAKRISDLEAKAPPPLPGSGEFEGPNG
jgi:hypothetical protein